MSQQIESVKKPIFQELTADDPDAEATVIESMCMNCEKNVSLKWKQ